MTFNLFFSIIGSWLVFFSLLYWLTTYMRTAPMFLRVVVGFTMMVAMYDGSVLAFTPPADLHYSDTAGLFRVGIAITIVGFLKYKQLSK